MTRRFVLLVAFVLNLSGQSQRPSFEVASVKLNTASMPNQMVPHRSGDRVTMLNTTLGAVVAFAFHLDSPDWQLAGSLQLPAGWNWYDIEAIAPASTSDDDLRLMFQSLLEDRFKLRTHRETREMTGYSLVIGKGGSKMKPPDPESRIGAEGKFTPAGSTMIGMFNDGAHLLGKGASMEQLVAALSGRLRGPVRDRTGLTGTFDFNVVFARENDPADVSTGPALTTVIQRDLGLRLEATKGTAEVLVIDHIEKPSEN